MSFNKDRIAEILGNYGLFPEVITLPVTGSTNDVARSLSMEKNIPCLVAADQQTRGKGSHGRSFYSPDETGFYLSFTIPEADPNIQMTLAAGVAVCDAIQEVCGIKTAVKWVNDIRYRGKKAGGILCERFPNGAVVVGIGINLKTPEGGFPTEISETAGALDTDPGLASDLAAAIYRSYLGMMERPEEILPRYKEKCETLGNEVKYLEDGKEHFGKAVDIEEDGSLLIQENGTVRRFSSGEISVRNV